MKCTAIVVLLGLAAANAFLLPPLPPLPSLSLLIQPPAPAVAVQRAIDIPIQIPALPRIAIQAAPAAPLIYAAPRLAPVQVIAPPAPVAVAVENAAVYRAQNLGAVHEAILPGHSQSVLADNLEPAGGTSGVLLA